MTVVPPTGGERGPNDRRTATFGVGGVAAGITAIMTAGGGTGVNNDTIRHALTVFAVLVSLALLLKAFLEWKKAQ